MERPAKRQFWLHQAAEYVIGLALIATGLQSPSPALPAIAGGVVMANVAIVHGPLSAFRIVNRRTHQVLDWVVIVGIAVSLLLPLADVATRLLVVPFVLVLAVVARQTNYGPSVKAQVRQNLGSGDRSEEIGRWAGRWVGKGVQVVRKHQDDDTS